MWCGGNSYFSLNINTARWHHQRKRWLTCHWGIIPWCNKVVYQLTHQGKRWVNWKMVRAKEEIKSAVLILPRLWEVYRTHLGGNNENPVEGSGNLFGFCSPSYCFNCRDGKTVGISWKQQRPCVQWHDLGLHRRTRVLDWVWSEGKISSAESLYFLWCSSEASGL